MLPIKLSIQLKKAHPLGRVYPIVWLDAIHYKIRDDGKICSKVIYTILGMNFERQKEVLGLYLSESKGANFWLQVLTDLSNRGVKDILIDCVDGLKGFPEAIETIFSNTRSSTLCSFPNSKFLKICWVKTQKRVYG